MQSVSGYSADRPCCPGARSRLQSDRPRTACQEKQMSRASTARTRGSTAELPRRTSTWNPDAHCTAGHSQVTTGAVADTLPEGLTPRKLVRGASRGGDDPTGVQRADSSDGRPSVGKATQPPADTLPGADLPPVIAPSRWATFSHSNYARAQPAFASRPCERWSYASQDARGRHRARLCIQG